MTPDQRADAVRRVAAGEKVPAIAADYGVSKQSVYHLLRRRAAAAGEEYVPAWDSEQLDREFLAAIVGFIDKHNYPPSLREIGALTGKQSPATAKRRLDRLVSRGWVTQNPGSPRSIVVMKTETEDLA